MIKLKRCPYCRCEEVTGQIEYDRKMITVSCTNCPAEMALPFSTLGLDNGSVCDYTEIVGAMRMVARFWNRRVGDDAR